MIELYCTEEEVVRIRDAIKGDTALGRLIDVGPCTLSVEEADAIKAHTVLRLSAHEAFWHAFERAREAALADVIEVEVEATVSIWEFYDFDGDIEGDPLLSDRAYDDDREHGWV